MHGTMLNHQGYSVTILERDTAGHREGFDAGIRVGPDFGAFLDEYDRVKRPYDIHATGAYLINSAGEIGRKMMGELSLSSWGLLISILRANFDGTTSRAVPVVKERDEGLGAVEYRNGALVKGVEDCGEAVRVRYEDAGSGEMEEIDADIVVVADGSNSSIRRQLMPGVERTYAGYVSWRGTVRESLLDERFRGVFEGKAVFHLMERNYILV